MKKTLFMTLTSLSLFACNGSEIIEKQHATGNYYDPQKPVVISEMLPSWGQIDQNYLIRGNFPKDTANIRVYFGIKKAVVLGCDGRELYVWCLNFIRGSTAFRLWWATIVSLLIFNLSIIRNSHLRTLWARKTKVMSI